MLTGPVRANEWAHTQQKVQLERFALNLAACVSLSLSSDSFRAQ